MRGGAATENYGEVAMFLLILDLHYKDDALQLNTWGQRNTIEDFTEKKKE